MRRTPLTRFALPLTAAVGAMTLSACAAGAGQISNALQRYGLSESRADCAGDYLKGHLSVNQLSRLSRAAGAYGRNDPNPGQLTFGDLLRVGQALGDTRVPIELGAAAVACGIVGDIPIPRF